MTLYLNKKWITPHWISIYSVPLLPFNLCYLISLKHWIPLLSNQQKYFRGKRNPSITVGVLSCWFFVTPWTVACQAPLSRGFPRQEYWRGLPFPPSGDLPDPGTEPLSSALAGGLFDHWTTWESHFVIGTVLISSFTHHLILPKNPMQQITSTSRWQNGGLDFLLMVNMLSPGARTQIQAYFWSARFKLTKLYCQLHLRLLKFEGDTLVGWPPHPNLPGQVLCIRPARTFGHSVC